MASPPATPRLPPAVSRRAVPSPRAAAAVGGAFLAAPMLLLSPAPSGAGELLDPMAAVAAMPNGLRGPAPGCLAPPYALDVLVELQRIRADRPHGGKASQRQQRGGAPQALPLPPPPAPPPPEAAAAEGDVIQWEPPAYHLALHTCLVDGVAGPRRAVARRT